VPVVLGAGRASAKFRGRVNPKAARAVLRACWRELPHCALALAQGAHYALSSGVPLEACSRPPCLRTPRRRRRDRIGRNGSNDSNGSSGSNRSSGSNGSTITITTSSSSSSSSSCSGDAEAAAAEARAPTHVEAVAAAAHAAWRPCRTPADTQQCVACLNSTAQAVEKCMGPQQVRHPNAHMTRFEKEKKYA
jgi:hypothetical protein